MYQIVIWKGTGLEFAFNDHGILVECYNPGLGMDILFTNHNADSSGICIYRTKDSQTSFASDDHHDLIEYASVDTYENILNTGSLLATAINKGEIILFNTYPKDSKLITYVHTIRIQQKMNTAQALRQLHQARATIDNARAIINDTLGLLASA